MCECVCIYVFCVCLCVMRNGSMWVYGGGRESWGSAEGIGLGSRCVCLMSSCGERKEKGGREIFSKDFLPSNPISLFLPSCLLHMSAIRQNSFSLSQGIQQFKVWPRAQILIHICSIVKTNNSVHVLQRHIFIYKVLCTLTQASHFLYLVFRNSSPGFLKRFFGY